MASLPEAEIVEIRVEQVTQLFETHDPYPFRERSLDPAAEAYIVGHAESLRSRRPLHVVVHLPRRESTSAVATHLEDAITRHFSDRADATQRLLRQLFRDGRRSLVIGLTVLTLAHLGGRLAEDLPGERFSMLVAEGLIIFGWVANWRPMEIFLYDWWPIARRRNLYRRLAAASVSVTVAE
ncbi:hypothetical protein [Paraburkholderia dinghuensis]|uniref:Uncharacterized protein n=1 Tax=Paraburkholderia dinghuensis TaxID=2305225 RepID=A0A3N6N6U9_9BURK|nr:hypothetical protein [Paraburkholderia dinghuensis]RQH04672.1 hypothetical protein D1Y85_17430 [Paraburkholderia dinghuensis]